MFTKAEIGERLRTQDNLITANPIFVVKEKQLVHGVDPAYHSSRDLVSFWVKEGEQVDPELADHFDNCRRLGTPTPDGYEQVWAVKVDMWVQPFLTREAAQRYLDSNKHNMEEPFIYVESGYRNREWEVVRAEFMAEAGDEK